MPSKMKRTGAVNGRFPAFLEEQFLHEGTTPSNFVRGLRTGTGADGCAGSRRMGGRRSGRGAGYGKVYPHHGRCRRDAAGRRRPLPALTDSADYAAIVGGGPQGSGAGTAGDLVQQGLVAKGSIYADEENGMVSFSYSCGALGGILLEDPDEEIPLPTCSWQRQHSKPRRTAPMGPRYCTMPLTTRSTAAATPTTPICRATGPRWGWTPNWTRR